MNSGFRASGIDTSRVLTAFEKQLIADKVVIFRIEVFFCNQENMIIGGFVCKNIEKRLDFTGMVYDGLRIIVNRIEINLKVFYEFIIRVAFLLTNVIY